MPAIGIVVETSDSEAVTLYGVTEPTNSPVTTGRHLRVCRQSPKMII
jgi:type IV secretory pathway protease TraF